MHILTDREWMYLLQSIYRLYQAESYEDFCDVLWVQMGRMIPCKCMAFFKIDMENNEAIRRAGRIYPDENCLKGFSDFIDKKVTGSTQEMYFSPWSSVFRQTDVYTMAEWERTEIYRNYWRKSDFYFGLNAIFVYDDRALGAMTWFRSKKDGDFTEKELKIMDVLKEHMALKLYQLVSKSDDGVSADEKKMNAIYQKAAGYGLTRRESEVIYYFCMGMERSDIAARLFISDATLKKHIYNIYAKLSVNSLSRLIIWSKENLF